MAAIRPTWPSSQMVATEPNSEAVPNLHDFVFSLEDRGGSCCAKKDVVVLTGVTLHPDGKGP